MEWTPNKSQHANLTLEKKILPPLLPGFELATLEQKILPPLLPGFELATFRSRVRRYNQQAIPAAASNPIDYGRGLAQR